MASTTQAQESDRSLRRTLIVFTAINACAFVYNLTRSVELAFVAMIAAPFLFRRSRARALVRANDPPTVQAAPSGPPTGPDRPAAVAAPRLCALRWEDA